MSDLPASYWADQCRTELRKAREQREAAERNPDPTPAAHRGTTEQEDA